MAAGSKEVIEALDQIQKTNIDSIVISFLIAAVALMLLKIIAEAITGYIQVRLDQHIAIGSPVEIYGKKGRISAFTIFTITVETQCGFIRVPTKSWRTSKFITLKDKLVLHNRRKDDDK
jgi:hypothetical protein